MVLAGDEFGRTQNCNNNAYCRTTRSAGSTKVILGKRKELIMFTQKRPRCGTSILRRTGFLKGEHNESSALRT